MVTVRTIYFNTGNSTSALSVYLYFCYDSFSENLLFHSTALIPFYLSLRRIWRCCINLSVQFPWSSSRRPSQLFECVIHCLIVSGVVWTVHFMTEPKDPRTPDMDWEILIHERNSRKHTKCKWIRNFRPKQHTVCFKTGKPSTYLSVLPTECWL